MTEKENEAAATGEGRRLFALHWFWPVLVFAAVVAVWAFSRNSVAGVSAFCTFAGLLIIAWDLLSRVNGFSVKYRDLDEKTKRSLWVTLIGIGLTAVGFGVGLPSIFGS